MKFIDTPLQGAVIIEPEPFKDSRGFFSRVYCQAELEKRHLFGNIVQINHSKTTEKGSVRGLHFQKPPASEIKLVKCIQGAVFDVIVDIRKNSITFLNWFGTTLTKENMKMLYIPKGFAHGFQTLKPDTELIYLHTEFYTPGLEGGLHFKDPALSIEWPLTINSVSKRDQSFEFINDTYIGLSL
ncbi:MAG: dTDP-4-dehydrorhamnose 3,5-epimerase [Desulfobacter sp.]|nr:MAG: dTDP-4-dehydrorhamnose 3,5-epimerase [Desulfobacter sp.]